MPAANGTHPQSKSSLHLTTLEILDDVLLGSVGRVIPPSDTLDHAVRFFGTWSGSDKLMMTAQYTAKLLIYYLNWRAERLYRLGRRDKPISLTVEGLFKFAGTLSMARRVSGLWGFLGIMKGLSALERNKPASQTQLTLQRVQGISMLVFYPLEFISFFSAPFAPVLVPRWITPKQGGQAALWSIRAWLVYVIAQVGLLVREREVIRGQEMEIRAKDSGNEKVATPEEHEAIRANKEGTTKRKMQIVYQLAANLSRLPVIMHWSVEGGIYPYEILTAILSLISALAAFKGGWENTRITAPTGR